MYRQAVLFPVKWDWVDGGGGSRYREGETESEKRERRQVVFKDMEAMGKLPPAHGIDAVHLVQWEMKADHSAIPPAHLFYLTSSTTDNNTIYPSAREGGRVTEGVTDTEAASMRE